MFITSQIVSEGCTVKIPEDRAQVISDYINTKTVERHELGQDD